MRKSFLERLAALSPSQRALLERRLERSATSDRQRIARAPRDNMIRASFSQERMWLVHQMYPMSIAYNSQVAIHFQGGLDVEALTRSLDELVRRHEIYRTCFVEKDGIVYQRIHQPGPARLRMRDISNDSSVSETWIRQAILEEISQPFRLDELPLVRWTLLRVESARHILICMDHHAVTDGWARNVALTELMSLYADFAAGQRSSLPEPTLQFADFAHWQRGWMTGAEGLAQLDYWTRQLTGAPEVIDLPYDRVHPIRPSFRGGHETMILEESELRPLRRIAARSQATMFMALLSVFAILLHRYSRSDELCIGTGIANRRLPDTDQMIGMLINTVVLRIDLSGAPGFLEALRRIRALTLESYNNQEAPFDKVVEALAPSRRPGINPLHQVTFNLQNNPMPAMSFPGLNATLERPLFNESAKYDLYVAGWPRSGIRHGAWQREDEAILLTWEYNTDVFNADTIRVMQGHFRYLLRSAGAHPELPISLLHMDDQDALRFTAPWRSDVLNVEERCITELFAEVVAYSPESVALEQGARQWTYRQLDKASDDLVPYLRQAGVGRDKVVAVAMERSPELIVSILAVLKAGGAYLPLDPGYPADYLATMLSRCRPIRILTTAALARGLPAGDIPIDIHEHIQAVSDAAESRVLCGMGGDSLAYVLFTSGSSGVPRAVAIPNRGVARLVRSSRFARMDASQSWLQLSPLGFDASTLEIWAPLCNGGRLVMMPPGLPSLDEIGAALRHYGITSLWLSAGLAQLMVSERLEDLAGIEQLLTGGDVVPLGMARALLSRFPGMRLINGYGPTENTTFPSCHAVDPDDLLRSRLPIGRPIAGTTVYVLDPSGRPCPIGVPGELCTGGAGLALGYWNDGQATADKFIDHREFGRLYRTGDLCRYRHDGVLDFLGRLDDQLKVRGFRVERGEVERALLGHPAIQACVVVARGDSASDKALVAYFVPSDDKIPSEETLRAFLRQRLPAHMLPARFLTIGRVPLTVNGKIDDRALRDSHENLLDHFVTSPKGPGTPLENIVSGVWQDVLGQTDLGLHEDFFDAGGHSLAALKIIALIEAKTGIELSTLDFFEGPTIASLAVRAEQRAQDPWNNARPGRFLVELKQGRTGKPLIIIPGGWGEPNEILVFAGVRSYITEDCPIYALRSRATDRYREVPEHIEQQAADLLEAISEVAPGGDYVLLGECAASTVVMAMASLAESQGRAVNSVILLDPGPVSHLCSLTERMAGFMGGCDTGCQECLPVEVARYYRLLGTWKPRPVSCPLHILLSSRFSDVASVRKSWEALAKRQLYIHEVRGDHVSYLRDDAEGTAHVLDTILSRTHDPSATA